MVGLTGPHGRRVVRNASSIAAGPAQIRLHPLGADTVLDSILKPETVPMDFAKVRLTTKYLLL